MNELKVGLMAIATMIAVGYMSFKVTSNQSGFGEYVTYRTIISDASGIFPKTPIKVAGISAGRIKSIELQGNHALITFEVLEKILISSDSKLVVKTVGFLGDKYLEIQIGSTEIRLPENDFISSETGGGMENLMKDASVVMRDVKKIVQEIKDSLAPEGQKGPIKKILDDVQALTENVKQVTATLKKTITGNEERINNIVKNFENFSRNLSAETDKGLEGSSVAKIQEILDSTKSMTGDLESLIADIKAGKGTVGKLLVEEEIADEVRETLAGVKKIVGKVENIRTELAVFTGASTNGQAETDAALKIFPAPERFYVLGITTSEFGPETEKITTTSVNGGAASSVVTKEKDKDSYRFNVQLGRKIQNWHFRGGLIESSGGLGLDYDFTRIGSRFSMEVFDYDEDLGPTLRISSQLQMWNVFYGKVSVDSVSKNFADNVNSTISAGLRFNDEDLKGLIGFFF